MIPKLIHYCWLSNEERPEMIKECMNTWGQHMPDYQIICWDSARFDVNSYPFVKAAVKAKKWAFAADYIRLFALYNHGGIYLDSDVEVYKPFDIFLNHRGFSSIEHQPLVFYRDLLKKGLYASSYSGNGIDAAILGAEPKHPFIAQCLEYYNHLSYVDNQEFRLSHLMPNILAKIAHEKYGFKYVPKLQKLNCDFILYPSDVFSDSSKDSVIGYSRHLGANSWGKDQFSKKQLFLKWIEKHFPALINGIKKRRVS